MLFSRFATMDFFSAIRISRTVFVAIGILFSFYHGLIGTAEAFFGSGSFGSVTPTEIMIAGGDFHSIILEEDGSVWSCGLNSNGQLGNPSITYSSAKFEKTTITSGAKDVAGGTGHSIVLKQDGSVWTSGTPDSKDAAAKTDEFVFIRVIPGAKAIAAGGGHSLVLAQHGSVWATGVNLYGQLGDGTNNKRTKFVQVVSNGAKAVAAGNAHSIVLKVDGSVLAVGANGSGQLGDGSTAISVILFMPVMSSCVAVAAGAQHSIVIKEDGSVWSTGSNTYGQLGDGTTTDKNAFSKVAGNAKAISAGAQHSLLLKQDGSVWTTLFNVPDQTGDFSGSERGIFVQVISSGGKAVATGGYHSMVLKEDGTIWAAGSNKYGQIGNGAEYQDNIRNFVRVGPSGKVVPVSTTEQSAPTEDSFLDDFSGRTRDSTTGFASLSLGAGHTFILKEDGSVWTTGANAFGQLGVRFRANQMSNFVEVFPGGVRATATGGGHSMVLKNDASVWVTGRNLFGQLGDGTKIDKETFIQIFSSGVKAVAAGGKHSLVLKDDGGVWTAGCNRFGQLGDGSIRDRNNFVQVFLEGMAAISGGSDHSIVLARNGNVWASGANSRGQLGDGTTTSTRYFVKVLTAVGAKAIAAGGYHSMVLKQDGSVWTTGSNQFGQLGDSAGNSRSVMKQVSNDAKAIAAGLYHSVVLAQDGSVWASGNNDAGQLGDGSTKSRSLFIPVMDSGARVVAAGGWHSMILTIDDKVLATGENQDGQLGDNSHDDKVSFAKVAHASNQGFGSLSLGAGHSLIVNQNSVWAAGWNAFGQLGTGSRRNKKATKLVKVLSGFTKAVVGGGGKHSLALKLDGSVWATGRNVHGQLGDGTNVGRNNFVKVVYKGVQAVAAGSKHSLLVKEDGTVWATGCNLHGQLGDGSEENKNKFVKVFLNGAEAAAAGAEHSLVLGRDGSVWATGANYFGQLGDASITSRRNFVRVLSAGAKAIAAGGYHSVVLKRDGSVWSMGANESGQLGDGSRISRKSLSQVANTLVQPFNAKAVAAGFYHSMVLKQDGSVWSTGRNDFGQLGDGSRVYRSTYVNVMSGAQAVAAGGWHSMVLSVDGNFWSTGRNSDGQLGDGTTIDKTMFVRVAQVSDDESEVARPVNAIREPESITDMAMAVLRGTAKSSRPACPKCGTTNIPGKLSCCGRGGAWFKKCGDVDDKKFDHTWDEGIRACKTTEAASTVDSASRAAKESPATSTSAIGSTRCPKCGMTKKSGKLSCCARGGAWFQKCGEVDNKNFEHTWTEGVQACKILSQAADILDSTAQSVKATATVPSAEITPLASAETSPKTSTPAKKSCARCGTIKVSGKPSCCAYGGAWFRKCGKVESKKFEYTWAEGTQACGGFMDSVSGEVPGLVRDQRSIGQLMQSTEWRSISSRPTSVLKVVNASDDHATDGEGRVEYAKFIVFASVLSLNSYLYL